MTVIDTALIADLPGTRGELPGSHRKRHGAEWEAFKQDIAANGIREPIRITMVNGVPRHIDSGTHRRDAAVELGLDEVPVFICYGGLD